jgi:hypothetical protein
MVSGGGSRCAIWGCLVATPRMGKDNYDRVAEVMLVDDYR